MISSVCLTMRFAITFLPLFRPLRISELASRSTIGHCVCWCVLVLWGGYVSRSGASVNGSVAIGCTDGRVVDRPPDEDTYERTIQPHHPTPQYLNPKLTWALRKRFFW